MPESSRPALLTSIALVAVGALAAYGAYRLLRSARVPAVAADDDRAPAPQPVTTTAAEVRQDAIDHERLSPGSVGGVAESAATA
ncbi:MAG TPA: hypothetical protein VEL07_01895 [Planctomycetota bacterium]|nr:hypothetical protein [Planctomycetota bacterium]